MNLKLRVIAAGSIACLVLGGCSSQSSDEAALDYPTESPSESQSEQVESSQPTPATSPSPSTPTSYWDILVGTDVTTKELCESYQKVINQYEGSSSKRNSAMKGKLKDAYIASSFKKGKSWLTADFSSDMESDIQSAVVAGLNSLSNGRANEIPDTATYATDSLQLCGLSDRLSKVRQSVKKAEDTAGKIVAKAATRPWYSKGYSEYSDGLAYKYTTFSGGDPCGYSRCRYGKVTVESRDGCFRGLYGEMNFYDNSGNVRDWDIESVPVLYPGKKVTLSFKSYSLYGSGTIQLTSLSCY
jgi:hypothetical protein